MKYLTVEQIATLHSEFPCCCGLGWKMEARPGTEADEIPDVLEVYCDCAAGQERKRLEG